MTPVFFIVFSLFAIMGMQTDNTLIVAKNNFASKKKVAIKSVKIIIKDWKYFTFL